MSLVPREDHRSPQLREADLSVFNRLGIPPELLAAAGVHRVTDADAREKYGIRGGGDMSGVAFPYFEPSTMSNGLSRWYVRIRRDHPDIEDGKEKKKYVAPYGDRKHLYFPPRPDWFADVSIPIVLVEAEKSALALTAWAQRNGHRLLALAMGGCWGWRGKVGIKETASGERVPEHDVIPDLNICRDCRKTYVLLDSNCTSNPKVQAARTALVRQLRSQGADVTILDLPTSDGVNGPDDYIAVFGDDAMARVFDGSEDGGALLNDLERYIRRFARLTVEQAVILAVYILHTHVIDASTFTPYIQIWSAVMRSGKTRVLELLKFLVCDPWMTERVSAAALVRMIAKSRPTLLLDESDTAFASDKDYSETLRGILNAGFQRGGCAHLCVKEKGDWDVKEFPVFCPKVIAGIGMERLPATVRDRSISIEMKRKRDDEKIEDFDSEDEFEATAPLRKRIQTWAEQSRNHLKCWPKPEKLSAVSDRQRDICNPLLKIADFVGEGWLPKLKAALTSTMGAHKDDQPLNVQLLADIREVFHQTETDRLPSDILVTHLIEIEASPWAEFNNGKPITANRLSRLLKPFKIQSRKLRFEDKTPWGYLRESFADAWSRYLPQSSHGPAQKTEQAEQTSVHAGMRHFSKTEQPESDPVTRSEGSAVVMRVVPNVPLSAPELGRSGGVGLPSCHKCGSFAMYREKNGTMTCGSCSR
jgi:hypothetical protein